MDYLLQTKLLSFNVYLLTVPILKNFNYLFYTKDGQVSNKNTAT